jgi:hypothetical protein
MRVALEGGEATCVLSLGTLVSDFALGGTSVYAARTAQGSGPGMAAFYGVVDAHTLE